MLGAGREGTAGGQSDAQEPLPQRGGPQSPWAVGSVGRGGETLLLCCRYTPVGGSERCLEGETWAPPSFCEHCGVLAVDTLCFQHQKGQTGVGPTQKPLVSQGRDSMMEGNADFREWFTSVRGWRGTGQGCGM